MKIPLIGFCALAVWLTPAWTAENAWSRVGNPLPTRPQVIGAHNAGCLAGGVALPLVGTGFQVMRPSRNRYYGHPVLIAFVKRLGQQAAARGQRLLVGDLAQPRGGPMPSGHRSHQTGLDVDIWFEQGPRGRELGRAETEQLPMLTMVRTSLGSLDDSRWSPRYRDALKLAADAPEVDRIFVNPIIKQALCQGEFGDRTWLQKIRPWWGHDAHFHVRLRCPAGSAQCEDQAPAPLGDGCDADLDRWVNDIRLAALRPTPPKPARPPTPVLLPAACTDILDGEGIRLQPVADPGGS